MQALTFIASTALGITLILSGLGKLRDISGFVVGVLEYALLPSRLAKAAGYLIPFIELACGAGLLAGFLPPVTGACCSGLLVVFLFAVSVNLWRGRTLKCYCFGSHVSEAIGWPTQARLVVLIACGISAATRGQVLFAPPPQEALAAILCSSGVVVGLYLLGSVPAQWSGWRTAAAPGLAHRGGCVSLRNDPFPPTGGTAPLGDGIEPVPRVGGV